MPDTSKPTAQDLACAAIFLGLVVALLYAPSILRAAGLFQ